LKKKAGTYSSKSIVLLFSPAAITAIETLKKSADGLQNKMLTSYRNFTKEKQVLLAVGPKL
jgi:hypothetical protein